MSIARGLKHLGFVPLEDFVLQDDGNGPYISEWLSDKQKPTVADIDLGYTAWEKEQIAKQDRLSSAKEKLEALGLTTEEVKTAFGI